ncbi:MAG: hypothetical protein M1817_000312 [Caeruleum heppii]|nr:MAG: hypothetical protein M1817_000312 [Caeruleum heppii]
MQSYRARIPPTSAPCSVRSRWLSIAYGVSISEQNKLTIVTQDEDEKKNGTVQIEDPLKLEPLSSSRQLLAVGGVTWRVGRDAFEFRHERSRGYFGVLQSMLFALTLNKSAVIVTLLFNCL